MTELDATDRKLLALLQKDSRLSVAELSEHAGLTPSPCWRRVQRLRDEGIIEKEVVLLNRKKVGLNAQIFAQVRLSAQGRANLEEFAEQIRSFPEVLDCYVVLGETDFLLRIVARDIDAYEQFFFNKLSRVAGIQSISSIVALSEIKATTVLPV